MLGLKIMHALKKSAYQSLVYTSKKINVKDEIIINRSYVFDTV